MLVVIRYRDRENQQVIKVDYYLSNAGPEIPLRECARVAKAEHRIEECLQRSKSEAGSADYEVRHWTGWQHHQTFSRLATRSLVWETERGKKMDPCDHLLQIRQGIAMILHEAFQCGTRSHMLKSARSACNAMSWLAFITGASVTDWLH